MVKKKNNVKTFETMDNPVYWIAFWGLAVLLFVSPFFRGLFFAVDQQKALLFITVVFWLVWLWKWSARDYKFLVHPLDFLALAFVLVYILSTVFAVNTGMAVDATVKALLYFIVYWSVVQLVRGEADANRILNVFYASAIVVSLAGLATSTGVIHIKDGFVNGRIFGPFQYPNALASYLAAVFFIGVYLWHRSLSFTVEKIIGKDGTLQGLSKRLRKANPYPYLYALGNFLILAVFTGARSNGGFIVITSFLLLFMIGLPRFRDKALLHILFTAAAASFAISRFLASISEGFMDGAWLWILAGLLMTAAGQVIVDLYRKSEKCNSFISTASRYRKVLVILAVLIIAAVAFGGALQLASDQGLQEQVKAKIKVHNLYHRVYFIADAIEMIKDRPVSGWGGGGWEEAYRSYQSYLYDSNEVHSYYFQLGVETGFLGLLVTAAVLLFFLRSAHRVYYGSGDNLPAKELLWAVFVAAAALSAHAVVDFDLSLSSISFVWWSMFAIAGKLERIQDNITKVEKVSTDVQSKEQKPQSKKGKAVKERTQKGKKYEPRKKAVLACATIAALIIMLAGGALVRAASQAAMAAGALQGQNLNKAIEHMESAVKYNPFNPDYHLQLAQYYSYAGKPDQALDAGEKALERGKCLADRYALLSTLAQSQGDTNSAIEYAEKAVEMAPFQVKWFENLSRMYFVIGINELGKGEKESAREHMIKAAGIRERVQKVAGIIPEEKEWLTDPVRITSPVNLSAGVAEYFLGNWEEAEKCLESAVKENKTKGEAAFWLSILSEKLGEKGKAEDYYKQATELVPDLVKSYDVLKKLPVFE